MSGNRSAWMLRTAVPMLVAVVSGCEFLDADVGSYLSVGFAQTQPTTSDLGVVVVVQQRGGSFLRLRTPGGAHQLSTTDGNVGVERSCVKLMTGDVASADPELLFFTVKPQGDECILYADLLADGANCTGQIAEARVLVVSRERATAPGAQATTTTATGSASSAGGSTGGGADGAGGSGGGL